MAERQPANQFLASFLADNLISCERSDSSPEGNSEQELRWEPTR